MNREYFTRKRPLISNSVAIILFCALSLAVFAPLCLFSHHDTDFNYSGNCLFSVHSFNYTENGLSALLIIPLIGVFALIANVIIIEGYIWPPFKPPRLQSKFLRSLLTSLKIYYRHTSHVYSNQS